MNERIEHITKQVDEYFDDLSIEFSRATTQEERNRAADSYKREEPNNGWADSPFGYYD